MNVRRISATEWAYLAAMRGFPPLAIQLWIRADRSPPLESLQRAVDAAAAANPGSRWICRGRFWRDSGRSPVCRQLEGNGFSARHSLFRQPFADVGEAPPIEVVAVTGSGVIFRCAHALMDAHGLLFFAEEVFRALRGEPVKGSSCTVSDEQWLRTHGRAIDRGWPQRASRSPLGTVDPTLHGFAWEHVVLSSSATLTARVASELLQAVGARGTTDEAAFLVPVNLRRSGPALRTTGNMSNALLPRFTTPLTWQQIYRRLLVDFADHCELRYEPRDTRVRWLPLGLLGGLQRAAHRRCMAQDRYYFTAVISNVGEVSLAKLSCAGFTARSACFLPTDAPGVALTLVITRHDHGAEIHASAPAGTALQLADLLSKLGSALSTPSAKDDTQNPLLTDSFCRQTESSPAQRAVSEGDGALSYAELDQLARRWTARLRAAGVRSGDRVVVVSSRSLETPAVLLGILRSGAAFVPLDDGWPAERIDKVIADCRPACIVTDRGLDGRSGGIALLRLGGQTLPEHLEPDAALTAGQAAYVIYTSGSTGRPKGVVVTHGNLANYLNWARGAYVPEGTCPVCPLFTSLAFDLTQTSLWLPLICGGEVRVIAERDPLRAAKLIRADASLTTIKLTPSHLRLLNEVALEHSRLNIFIVGGEVFPTALARQTQFQYPGARIFNEYGPTEATVGCIAHEFDAVTDPGVQVPIGCAIDRTHIRLLDWQGQPVPDGATGEIVIAGASVAGGYLTSCPEETRFAQLDGERVYRSGDLGSRKLGQFHYHGRLDEQVKIRGHRVELGEVETAIMTCEAVASAAVVEMGGQLVAFVVWQGQRASAALRAHLAQILPDHMLPARIESIAALPLTTNGKVDRMALVPSPPPCTGTAEAAESPVIEELTRMLADLLGQPAATLLPDRSLLEQGCDSLHIALLVNRVAKRYSQVGAAGLLNQLDPLVVAPTLRQLASLVEARNCVE